MNGQYFNGWQKCVLCGLSAADVAPRNPGDPPVCPNVERCNAVRNGESLGGALWPKKVDLEAPEPPAPDFKGEKPPPPIEPEEEPKDNRKTKDWSHVCDACSAPGLGHCDNVAYCDCDCHHPTMADALVRIGRRAENAEAKVLADMVERFLGPDGSFNI